MTPTNFKTMYNIFSLSILFYAGFRIVTYLLIRVIPQFLFYAKDKKDFEMRRGFQYKILFIKIICNQSQDLIRMLNFLS